MKIAIAKLTSVSPYSQARHYVDDVPKLPKERPDAYEVRTWRNRLHASKDGHVEIPGSAFAECVKQAARRLRIKVPGKGTTEFTKYFEAGIMVPENSILDIEAAEVPCDKLFVPSNGQAGGGKRVTKFFPRIDSWTVSVKFYVFDDAITEDVFRQVLNAAGMLVGIGRFRPEKRGFYGRFSVDAFQWIENADGMFGTQEAAE